MASARRALNQSAKLCRAIACPAAEAGAVTLAGAGAVAPLVWHPASSSVPSSRRAEGRSRGRGSMGVRSIMVAGTMI